MPWEVIMWLRRWTTQEIFLLTEAGKVREVYNSDGNQRIIEATDEVDLVDDKGGSTRDAGYLSPHDSSWLKTNFNSSLPLGQVVLKFCLPGQVLVSSCNDIHVVDRHLAWDQWKWKVPCAEGESTYNVTWTTGRHFFELWIICTRRA